MGGVLDTSSFNTVRSNDLQYACKQLLVSKTLTGVDNTAFPEEEKVLVGIYMYYNYFIVYICCCIFLCYFEVSFLLIIILYSQNINIILRILTAYCDISCTLEIRLWMS